MNLFVFKYGGILNGYLRRLVGISTKIGGMLPGLKYDLQEAGYVSTVGEYVAVLVANSFFYGLCFFLILAVPLSIKEGTLPIAISQFSMGNLLALAISVKVAFTASFVLMLVFFSFLLYYPKVEARKIAENIDRDLVFALKDMQLQISSGVPLYDAMRNVAHADYGRVSREFDTVVRDVNAGGAEDKALEKLADRTDSEFMRKTIWQMLTSLRAGSSLEGALKTTISTLNNYQRQQIKGFTGELNALTLVYMIFAVAIPGLGSTLLIVLSAFGGIKVNEFFYIALVSLCFFVEMVIIGFIKSRRPAVHSA
ncbi:MAG: type II secretion system F family protein [Candidatus Micrarchaeota archaeon]